MKTVLVTGSNGFVGRNLCVTLARIPELTVLKYDVDSTPEELDKALAVVDVIFHLAGVNRPKNVEDFKTGNADFTKGLCDSLLAIGRSPLIVLSSSVQAALDNPYGISKRQAEIAVEDYARKCATLSPPASSASSRLCVSNPPPDLRPPTSDLSLSSPPASSASSRLCVSNPPPDLSPFSVIFRFPNVFGKWCRPNYNSAVATWCHNIANDLPIAVRDPEASLTLVYVDDVVNEFLTVLKNRESEVSLASGGPGSVRAAADTEVGPPDGSNHAKSMVSQIRSQTSEPLTSVLSLPTSDLCPPSSDLSPEPCLYKEVSPTFTRTLGQITESIHSFKASRETLVMPELRGAFERDLYATFLTYLPEDRLGYDLPMKRDERGWLAEFIKSDTFGQIFVSRTKPGITRGNHWHHTKVEKFLVIEGEAVVRFRQIETNEILEYEVSGSQLRVVDIPAGYTHSITNVGTTDLITLFWASEIFDSQKPDTLFEKV